jgi:hypothetical protein
MASQITAEGFVANFANELLLSKAIKEIGMEHLWKSIRKLSSMDAILVVHILRQEKNGLLFGELLRKSAMSPNDLNHVLSGLKSLDLVIKSEDKRYYLTNYCVLLLDALKYLKETLAGINEIHAVT